MDPRTLLDMSTRQGITTQSATSYTALKLTSKCSALHMPMPVCNLWSSRHDFADRNLFNTYAAAVKLFNTHMSRCKTHNLTRNMRSHSGLCVTGAVDQTQYRSCVGHFVKSAMDKQLICPAECAVERSRAACCSQREHLRVVKWEISHRDDSSST